MGLQQARGPSSSSSPFPLRVIGGGGGGGSTGQKKGLSGWADVCEFLAAWAPPPAAAAASKKKGGREGGIGGPKVELHVWLFFYREGVRERGRS